MSTETQPDTEPTPHSLPWTPEKRDKMSDRISALWHDPAYRARMSAKMRAGWARRRARLADGVTD